MHAHTSSGMESQCTTQLMLIPAVLTIYTVINHQTGVICTTHHQIFYVADYQQIFHVSDHQQSEWLSST